MQDNAFSFDIDDFDDLMAVPETVESEVLEAISRKLETTDIHNWIDLYFAGADKLNSISDKMPASVAHKIVVPLVSQVIEDAI